MELSGWVGILDVSMSGDVCESSLLSNGISGKYSECR